MSAHNFGSKDLSIFVSCRILVQAYNFKGKRRNPVSAFGFFSIMKSKKTAKLARPLTDGFMCSKHTIQSCSFVFPLLCLASTCLFLCFASTSSFITKSAIYSTGVRVFLALFLDLIVVCFCTRGARRWLGTYSSFINIKICSACMDVCWDYSGTVWYSL